MLLLLVVATTLGMQDSPLKPLLEIGKSMQRGADAFLAGASWAEAFKPWLVNEADGKKTAELRETLKTTQVTQLSHMGFEFSLVLVKQGKSLGWLRTTISMDGEEAGFTEFRYQPLSPDQVPGLPLASLPSEGGTCAAAARAMDAAIKSAKDAAIHFPDPQKIAKRIVAEDYLRTILWSIEESKKGVAKDCALVAGLDHDEVRVRLDEVLFLAIAADGTRKGVLEANFDVAQDRYALHLDRWRPFK